LETALGGADWLHVSGVTPAVSANAADAALRAVKAARSYGVKVSFDANFRAKLWEARGDDPRPTLNALFAEADLMFAKARDITLVTGDKCGSDEDAANRLRPLSEPATHRATERKSSAPIITNSAA
jgi:2-dehydro-3-deoxygluconokinase